MIQNKTTDTISFNNDSLSTIKETYQIPDSSKTITLIIKNEKIGDNNSNEPNLADWLIAFGTISAVILSLIFSGISLLRKRRRYLVKTKSIFIHQAVSAIGQTIQMETQIFNNSSVPLELFSIQFQYNKNKFSSLYPISFKPKEGKITISPLNSKRVYLTAYKTDLHSRPLKQVMVTSYSEMGNEFKNYLKYLEGGRGSKIRVDKKHFIKVLNNLDVLTGTNLDAENYFRRKMTKRGTKSNFDILIRKIDEYF